MDETKSSTAAQFDSIETTKQAFESSKKGSSSRCENTRLVHNVLLIWLDDTIDTKSENFQHRIDQLRRIVNAVSPFTDTDECINFLKGIQSGSVFIIISGALCQKTLPIIHDITRLHTIYIFCEDETIYEQWSKEYPEIKGIFSDITPICEALKRKTQQVEQNAISISYIKNSDVITKTTLDQLDPTFMYTQIFKEILLSIEFEAKHIKEFVDYFHDVFAKNRDEVTNVNELYRKYYDETPIWWYTRGTSLYEKLNRALRLMDINILMKMNCFVSDLHRHIEKLHREQFGSHRSDEYDTVYRGQGMFEADFNQLINTNGGLMSFNNFLSTSKDRAVALAFAESAADDSNLIGILFVMAITPSESTAPFACINEISHFGNKENEVLFAMHTIFRISNVEPINNNNRLFQVNLALTTDNDKDLSVLTDHIRAETFPNSKGWYRLSLLLLRIGYFDKAQEVNEAILEQTTDMNEKAVIYHQIASTKESEGKLEEAVIFNEKAHDILEKILPLNHPKLAMSYNNIGTVYCRLSKYSEAILCYEKALEIRQQSVPLNQSDLFMSYHNIGNMYLMTDKYPKALSSYEKALEVNQNSLPSNHPNLAACYNSIGLVYRHMKNYSNALLYHEKALGIQKKTLPSNHSDLALSYQNIALVYDNMSEYSKALPYYEKAQEILEKTLPPTHPIMAMFYNNIGSSYFNMGEYSKALSYYEKALEIRQQSFSPNHPNLAMSYHNIGSVHLKKREYSTALSFYEKALEVNQNSLPSNHPGLAACYNSIGLVYRHMKNYSNALLYHEKALEIQQKILASNHTDLADSYNNIATVYYDINEYSQALSFHQKALEIGQEVFPANHPHLAGFYNNIGNVYSKMGDYSKALLSYKKAFGIGQQTLPFDHPDMADFYNNIGVIHRYMNDYSNALLYHEKALEISQKFLHPNHPDIATLYNDIGIVYNEMEEFSKAFLFFERAVDIAQCSLSPDNPNLEKWRKNMEDVKNKL